MSWPEDESWDSGITQNTVIVSTVTEAPHRAGQLLGDKSIWLKDIISIYVIWSWAGWHFTWKF